MKEDEKNIEQGSKHLIVSHVLQEKVALDLQESQGVRQRSFHRIGGQQVEMRR